MLFLVLLHLHVVGGVIGVRTSIGNTSSRFIFFLDVPMLCKAEHSYIHIYISPFLSMRLVGLRGNRERSLPLLSAPALGQHGSFCTSKYGRCGRQTGGIFLFLVLLLQRGRSNQNPHFLIIGSPRAFVAWAPAGRVRLCYLRAIKTKSPPQPHSRRKLSVDYLSRGTWSSPPVDNVGLLTTEAAAAG